LTLLADALDLMQHRRAQKVCFTCDHYSVRFDPVDRKLADNRFEFVRRELCAEVGDGVKG